MAVEEVIRKVTPNVMTWKQYGEAAYGMAKQKLTGGPEFNYMPDYTQCESLHTPHFLVVTCCLFFRGLFISFHSFLHSN